MTLRDEEGPGAVGREVVLDAELGEFPGGEPRPLQQRAGLPRDDVSQGAPVAQRPDHAERAPPAQAGERPGVAVRVHLERARAALLDEERGAPFAQPHADIHRGVADREGGGLHHGGAAGQRGRDREYLPAQVHRRRAGIRDPLDLGVEPADVPSLAFGLPDRERNAERAGHPEERRAPHGQPDDRVHELIDGGDPQHGQPVRQGRLVDGGDVAVPPADNVVKHVAAHDPDATSEARHAAHRRPRGDCHHLPGAVPSRARGRHGGQRERPRRRPGGGHPERRALRHADPRPGGRAPARRQPGRGTTRADERAAPSSRGLRGPARGGCGRPHPLPGRDGAVGPGGRGAGGALLHGAVRRPGARGPLRHLRLGGAGPQRGGRAAGPHRLPDGEPRRGRGRCEPGVRARKERVPGVAVRCLPARRVRRHPAPAVIRAARRRRREARGARTAAAGRVFIRASAGLTRSRRCCGIRCCGAAGWLARSCRGTHCAGHARPGSGRCR